MLKLEVTMHKYSDYKNHCILCKVFARVGHHHECDANITKDESLIDWICMNKQTLCFIEYTAKMLPAL